MAAPRKIFRIEQTFGMRPHGGDGEVASDPAAGADLMQEISALRALLVAARPADAATPRACNDAQARPLPENSECATVPPGDSKPTDQAAAESAALPVSRLVQELTAVVTGAEHAALQILSAAEAIDQIAIRLADRTAPSAEPNPATEIRRLVGQIFASCHFQDLAGQRVTKVLAVLASAEEQLSRLLETFRNAPSPRQPDSTQHLYGPRLETDQGHAWQNEIDAMFDLEPESGSADGDAVSPAADAASGADLTFATHLAVGA